MYNYLYDIAIALYRRTIVYCYCIIDEINIILTYSHKLSKVRNINRINYPLVLKNIKQ